MANSGLPAGVYIHRPVVAQSQFDVCVILCGRRPGGIVSCRPARRSLRYGVACREDPAWGAAERGQGLRSLAGRRQRRSAWVRPGNEPWPPLSPWDPTRVLPRRRPGRLPPWLSPLIFINQL
jgi:hypothetical protein